MHSVDPLLHRRARTGHLLRLAPGIYVPQEDWRSRLPWDRYTLAAAAIQLWLPSATFSHTTALHLWGLPLLSLPRELHLAWPHTTHAGLQSQIAGVAMCGAAFAVPRRRYHVRPEGDSAPVLTSLGFRLAPLSESLVLSIARLPFAEAVVLADATLRRRPDFVGSEPLDRALSFLASLSALRRVTGVLEFASALSESPGESWSRAIMALQGFEPPILQQEFVTDGARDRVDCWWPSCGVIGEFDGKDKYLSLGGSSRADQWQALNAERQREARLRSRPEVRAVVRWTWDELRHPEQFARKLELAGVPRDRARRRRAA